MAGVQVLAVLAGAFGSLDTAVNVAFPDLIDGFGLEVGDLQWVVVCYVLAYGLSLLVAGRLGDARGHGSMLAGGAVVALIGLGVCSVASIYPMFLVGRVVQGIGTAMVMAAAPALVTLAAAAGSEGRAVGMFQTSAAIGLAIGPLLGGPLVAAAGWRSVFAFRLPLALALLLLARSVTTLDGRPEVRDGGRAGPPPSRWRSLVRSGGFVSANGLSVLVNGSLFATWLLVPSLLVDELGYSVLVAGVLLAVSPTMTAVAAHVGGVLADRGLGGRLVVGGMLSGALGMAILAQADRPGTLAIVGLGLALVGCGLGLFSVPNMATVMGALPPDRQGVAAGLSLSTRTLGIVLGAAATSALFDRLEASDGFGPAFRSVVLLMAGILAVASFLELGRRATTSS